MRWILWTSLALLAAFAVYTTSLSFSVDGRAKMRDLMQLAKFAGVGLTPEDVEASAEQEQQVLGVLMEEKHSLDKRKQLLVRKEAELRRLRVDIQKEMKQLTQTQQRLRRALDSLEAENDNVQRVVALFNGMSAQQAAERLQQLEQGIAVQLLVKMKAEKAAQVLGELPPQYVKQITEQIVLTTPSSRWQEALQGL